jgi:hypothetical protein
MVIERVRRAIKRGQFLREVRKAEDDHAAGSSAEFENVEGLIADLDH